VSEAALSHLKPGSDQQEQQINAAMFACRIFIYLTAFPQLLFVHSRKVAKAIRTKHVWRLCCLPIPEYWSSRQGSAGIMLTFCLLVMAATEPMLWCLSVYDDKGFTEKCDASKPISESYHIMAALALLLYFTLLIDLTVCSNRFLAFVLICSQMVPELILHLLALFWLVLLYASISSSIDSNVEVFESFGPSSLSLMQITVGMFPSFEYEGLKASWIILGLSVSFSIVTAVFLQNLLVAQLTCSFHTVWKDMVGYARLSRMKIIAEFLPRVPEKTWAAFLNSQGFDKKLEFNAGDVGFSGGIQVLEPAQRHPTSVDRVHRFGGSISASKPWPKETAAGDRSLKKRYEGLENLLKKTLKNTGGKPSGASAHSSRSTSSPARSTGSGDEQ